MSKEAIKNLEKCGHFEHYVSLGHCCHVASNLEFLGLRDSSMPLDWVISYWSTVENLFANNYKNFFNYKKLYQKKATLHIYKNLEYNIGFYHDFVNYKSLKSQLPNIKKKYKRRINRFFNNIKSPTLFIRYLINYDELVYISQNYENIEKMIKEHNTNNEIIFISHYPPENIDTSKIKFIFFITKDEDQVLNTMPISSCKELSDYLSNVHYEKRNDNLKFNEKKYNHKKTSFLNPITKLNQKYDRYLRKKGKKYIHDKQY